jgi:hypothetical protein
MASSKYTRPNPNATSNCRDDAPRSRDESTATWGGGGATVRSGTHARGGIGVQETGCFTSARTQTRTASRVITGHDVRVTQRERGGLEVWTRVSQARPGNRPMAPCASPSARRTRPRFVLDARQLHAPFRGALHILARGKRLFRNQSAPGPAALRPSALLLRGGRCEAPGKRGGT